jgi:hypothetical protein
VHRATTERSEAKRMPENGQVAAASVATSSVVRPDFTDRGWSSGSHPPTAYRRVCELGATAADPCPSECEPAEQFLSGEVEVQIALGDAAQRISG